MKYVKAAALYLIIFTQMLDTSVANLALSNIASDLHMDVLHASWVMTSFGTGVVISFSLGNLLIKKISPDFVLCIGSVIFIFSSLACGVVPTSSLFILCRFIQGLSSGMATIAAFPIMIGIFKGGGTAFPISLCTSAISLAPVAGPMVGAYLTATFGWRSIFLINIPLTAVGLLLLLPAFSLNFASNEIEVRRKMITLVSFSISVASMQCVLDFGAQFHWFVDSRISAGTFIAVISGLIFWGLNRNERYHLFDFSIFRIKSYRVATIVLVIGNGLLFSSMVFLPLWLRNDRNMSILHAGIIVSAASAVAALSNPFVGKYLPKRYFSLTTVVSLALISVSFFMMSRFTIDIAPTYIIGARILAGCGMAIFTMPLLSMALHELSPEAVANGNAVSITFRVMSSNIFIAIGFAIYNYLGNLSRENFIADADRVSYLNYLTNTIVAESNLSGLFHTAALTKIFFVTGIFFLICVISQIRMPVGANKVKAWFL